MGMSITPSGPGLVKCIRIKLELLSETARAYAFGACSLGDLEQAADELAEAKLRLAKAIGEDDEGLR